MAGENINQAELARVAALGQGKPQGGEEDGGDNGLMTLLTGAMNRMVSMLGKGGLPATSLISNLPSTGLQAGLESKDGMGGKPIMPSSSLSGGEGFFYKLFAALKKGGMGITDWTAGIGPMEYADVSWAQLGTLATPITPATEVGRGSGISYDM